MAKRIETWASNNGSSESSLTRALAKDLEADLKIRASVHETPLSFSACLVMIENFDLIHKYLKEFIDLGYNNSAFLTQRENRVLDKIIENGH